MMRRVFLVLFALLLAPFVFPRMVSPASAQDLDMPVTDLNVIRTPGSHVISINVDGHDRRFIFVTPSHPKAGQNVPIVFFFHGAGGTALQASKTYGWTEKAEKEHFFAVFPEGLPARPDETGSFLLNPHIWRDGRPGIKTSGIDDLHFFEVLLKQIDDLLPIDEHAIYVTGFSNGAAMTFALGAHFSDRIAAIAPISSQSFSTIDKLARPLPVYYLTGTADPLIPYHGGSVTLPWGNTRSMPPVQDSVDAWVRLDGCPAQAQDVSDENGVHIQRYGPGNDQAEILFTTIDGNGHHWPGTTEPLPQSISGPALDPFHATDAIWDFFVKHPLH